MSEFNNKLIGGLYITKSKKGTTYLKGKINDVPVLIFKTKTKKTDKSPDYTVYESTPLQGQEGAVKQTAPTQRRAVSAAPQRKQNPAPAVVDDFEEPTAPDGDIW